MKIITPDQHIAASLKPFMAEQKDLKTKKVIKLFEVPRFTKPGEPQKDAIRRLMSGIKRRANAAEPRNFPYVGMASTKAYVESFYRLNNLGTPPFSNLSTAPIEYEFDDAVVCEESDLV